MVDFALSMSDLELVTGFQGAVMDSIATYKQSYRVVEEVERHVYVTNPDILRFLYESGMNTDEPVEIVERHHRNLRNQVCNGPRFEGSERTDEKWLKSGAASVDAIIASVEDSSLRHGLRVMKCQGVEDQAFS